MAIVRFSRLYNMLNVPIEIFENAVKEKKQEAFSNFLLALKERKSNKIQIRKLELRIFRLSRNYKHPNS